MTDIDLKSLGSGTTFEKMCRDMLLRVHPDLRAVDGSGGDDGVDAVLGMYKDDKHIYQFKYFTGRLNDKNNRKQQILDSLSTAKEKNPEMTHWTLLIALDFTPTESEWFKEEIVDKNKSLTIDHWDKTKIENEIISNDTVLDRYFANSLISASRRVNNALPFLTEPPVKKILSIADFLKKNKEQNHHLGIEYKITSEGNKTNIEFNPRVPVEFEVKMKIKAERLNGYRDFQEFLNDLHKKGETFVLNEDEVEGVEFVNEDFKDIIPEHGIKLMIQPQYMQKEIDTVLEINPSGFTLEPLTFKPVRNDDNFFEIKADNLPYKISIVFQKQDETSKFNISYSFDSKPIYEIIKFIKLIDEFKGAENIIFRERSSGKIVMNGNIKDAIDVKIDTFIRNVVEALHVIEIKTSVSFTMPEQFTEDNLNYLDMARNLLVRNEHITTINNVSFIIKKDKAQELLTYYESNGKVNNMQSTHNQVTIRLFDVDIPIGDVNYKYPDLKIDNVEELKKDIQENKENISIKLSPLDEKNTAKISRS